MRLNKTQPCPLAGQASRVAGMGIQKKVIRYFYSFPVAKVKNSNVLNWCD